MTNKILDKRLMIESMDISDEVFASANITVAKDFQEYIKSDPNEILIKKACLHYFLARYVMEISNIQTSKGELQELIVIHHGVEELWLSLPNFRFCIGSCGIAGQKLAKSKTVN